MKKLLFIFLLTLPILTDAQDAKELLRLYFKEVREGKYPPIPNQFGLPENASKVLTGIGIYETDTAANVRSKAYAIIRFVGDKSRQLPIRQKAVYRMVLGCKDKDSGNVGVVLNYLTEFQKQDFTKESIESLKMLFHEKPPHFSQLLRLVGFLEISDLKESIRPYTLAGNSRSNRWSAIISLARMGDEPAINDMMTRTKKLPISDDVVYEIFPDLVYTRQKVALDYLVEVLYNDEKKCTSPGESEAPIICGYRIMEHLAKAVNNYPLQLEESGDLKTDDYTTALQVVRDWFKANPNYTIKKDMY